MLFHFEITLNGVTEDLDVTEMPTSLEDFLRKIKTDRFSTSTVDLNRIRAFEFYDVVVNEDGDHVDDPILVSSPNDYRDFMDFVAQDPSKTEVMLIVDPEVLKESKGESEDSETKDLLEKVKKALETDHSLAGKLKEIVREICGSHFPDHHRGYCDRGGCGGRGKGSHKEGRGRPPFENGRFAHPRHCHGHSDDYNKVPPPFPPFDHPLPQPPQFPHSPSPAHYAQLTPPPSSWNVDRVTYETWTPSFPFPPPPTFFGPSPRAYNHHVLPHHRSGRGRFPRHFPAPYPSFERGRPEFPPFGPPPPSAFHHFPATPFQRLPPREEEYGREIPGGFPRHQKSHGCCPSPPVPAEYRRPHGEAGAEDWEVDFEELSVH